MSFLRTVLLIVATMMLPRAFALSAAEERGERERIKRERVQVEAAYAAREQVCRERFVVTSCVEDARRDRREALERLRQQQAVLDEAQRKQRAAERMDEIRKKLSADDARSRDAVVRDKRQEKSRVRAHPAAPATTAAPAASAASGVSASRATGDAERRVAEYEKRQQEASEHRAAVARRNAERAASGKAPAKPLPAPASAALPASAAAAGGVR